MVAQGRHLEQRAPRVLVSVAAVAVVAIDVLYLEIIKSQDGAPPSPYVVPFIASFFAAIAAALLVSLVAPSASRAALRGAASGGLVVLTVLTALSIGAAVLVATVPCIVATVMTLAVAPRRLDLVLAGAGAVGAAIALLIGLQLAWAGAA